MSCQSNTTTVLKVEILELPQTKLNQIQQKSLLFQCKISNIQYLGPFATTQLLKLMKSVDSNIIAVTVLGDLCNMMSTHFDF